MTHFEEAFVRYDERFKEGCMYKVTPYEGIPELIAELKRRGIKHLLHSARYYMLVIQLRT